METSTANLVMILLFALRCIIPLALTLLIGWAMNRLVDKWAAEDAARYSIREPDLQERVSTIPVRQSGREVVKCWVFRDCGQTDCAAYQNPDLLCWKLKTEANGQLPAVCQQCAYYQMTIAIA